MVATPHVLVAYATAAGSTAGVAERIANVASTAGCTVVCRPAGPNLDVTGFDGFVLGSAVHDMAWLPSALELLRRVDASGDRPVWCFSVGGINPRGRFTRYVARREAERVSKQFPVGFSPRQHRVFAGVVTVDGTPLWGRLVYRLTGARAGDNRDWPAIETWATNVAAALITETRDHGGSAAGQYRPPRPSAAW
jgi:menaquinone-dependent protoporphyrinogen oxidase